MILALGLVLVGLVAVLLIASHLENAPEGFQDGKGFHLIIRETQTSQAASTAPMSAARKVAS